MITNSRIPRQVNSILCGSLVFRPRGLESNLEMAAKVIIDTDIGDVLVTAFALLSPELDVLGGWLEARPGRAYITVPPRGGLAELRV